MKKFLITLGAIGYLNAGLANDAVQLRSGVLFDPATQSVMIMLPEGGIAAVDMSSGEHKWTSSMSDKPLTVINGRVLSQKQNKTTGLLSLTYHGVGAGETLNTVELGLPEEVMATVVDGPAHQFSIETISTNTTNQLQWQFTGGKAQGIAPELPALSDQNTPQATTLVAQKTGVIDLNFTEADASISAETDHIGTATTNTEQVVLENIQGRQFLSKNGLHILVSNRIKSNQAIKYDWKIYTRSGEMVGEMNSNHSYAPFVVNGELMIFIEPSTGQLVDGNLVKNPPILKSINLKTSQQNWAHPIRSIKYFGQLPV